MVTTEYQVLTETDHETWTEIGEPVEASSAIGAIRKIAEQESDPSGKWRAVPTRSWQQPVSVQAEQKTTLTLSK